MQSGIQAPYVGTACNTADQSALLGKMGHILNAVHDWKDIILVRGGGIIKWGRSWPCESIQKPSLARTFKVTLEELRCSGSDGAPRWTQEQGPYPRQHCCNSNANEGPSQDV